MDEKKPTVAGEIMKHGGGAAVGAGLGYAVGSVAAVALAPFTFGLSVVIPFALGAAGGVMGHKAAKKFDAASHRKGGAGGVDFVLEVLSLFGDFFVGHATPPA